MILSSTIVFFLIIQIVIFVIFFFFSIKQKHNTNKIIANCIQSTQFKDIEVIVAAKEDKALLSSCLENVLRCGFTSVKVCLDGSSTEDYEYLKKEFPDVVFFRNENSQGKIKSQIQCITKSDKEFILILDADINLFVSEISGFVSYFKKQKIDFLCPYSVGRSSRHNSILFFLAEADRLLRQRIVRTGRDFFGVSNLSGYCLLANRRKYLDVIDGNAIQDDVIATLNLLEKGYTVKTYPKAVCSELERPTIKTMLFQKTRWTAGNILLLNSYPKLFVKTTFQKAFAFSSSFILWYWALWVDMISMIFSMFCPPVTFVLGLEWILKYLMLNYVSENKKMYFFNLFYIILWPLFATLCLVMCPFYLRGKINEQKTRR